MTNLDLSFSALADPTRRAILAKLMENDARVTEIAAPFDMSLNAVSKHVKILEHAGLVRRNIEGRDHRLSFNQEPLEDVEAWISAKRDFWEGRLDALGHYLKQKDK